MVKAIGDIGGALVKELSKHKETPGDEGKKGGYTPGNLTRNFENKSLAKESPFGNYYFQVSC